MSQYSAQYFVHSYGMHGILRKFEIQVSHSNKQKKKKKVDLPTHSKING